MLAQKTDWSLYNERIAALSHDKDDSIESSQSNALGHEAVQVESDAFIESQKLEKALKDEWGKQFEAELSRRLDLN